VRTRNPSCTKCGKGPPEIAFYVRANGIRSSECTGCHIQATARWYESQKLANPRKHLFDRVKYRARDEEIEFTITLEDVVIPEFCPVFPWIKLLPAGEDGQHPAAPTLDRWDPTKGYVPGNVRVISRRANVLKRDMSGAEADALARYIRGPVLSLVVPIHKA
jgi:hypothetical protein